MKSKEQILTVYFDGLCHLCSREIDHYRKQEGAERIRFLDITAPGFDATKEGVDPFEVHRVLHTRSSSGEVSTGVDSFIEIWSVLPKYKWAARLARRGFVRSFLNVGYVLFAKIRPLLPRKKATNCDDSPYCEVHVK